MTAASPPPQLPTGYGWPGKGPTSGQCRACGATIWWAMTGVGKWAQLDNVDPTLGPATSHFATCPDADRFRKPRR